MMKQTMPLECNVTKKLQNETSVKGQFFQFCGEIFYICRPIKVLDVVVKATNEAFFTAVVLTQGR